jgi:hypothetical protein
MLIISQPHKQDISHLTDPKQVAVIVRVLKNLKTEAWCLGLSACLVSRYYLKPSGSEIIMAKKTVPAGNIQVIISTTLEHGRRLIAYYNNQRWEVMKWVLVTNLAIAVASSRSGHGKAMFGTWLQHTTSSRV